MQLSRVLLRVSAVICLCAAQAGAPVRAGAPAQAAAQSGRGGGVCGGRVPGREDSVNQGPEVSGITSRIVLGRQGRTAAQQGMELSGRWLFCLEDGGNVNVHDFRKRDPEPFSSFRLASSRPDNHANNAEFGVERKKGASFPLMYITNGKVGSDIEWLCFVESVTRRGRSFSSELVQTIVLDVSGWEAAGLDPIFGAPSWLIDRERKALWVFSAHKRTTPQVTKDPSENRYIATKFRIPSLSEGPVVRLTADDVLDQKVFPFDAWFTQAGCMRDGKIYYCFGVGKPGRPSLLRIYDTDSGEVAGWDLQDQLPLEMEDLVFRRGRLLVNINARGLPPVYELTLPQQGESSGRQVVRRRRQGG